MPGPERLQRLLLLPLLLTLSLGCGGGPGPETPDPDEASAAQHLGREVGETYLLLIDDTRAMLSLNLPGEQIRLGLGRLRDDYRVRFANLGCLRQDLPEVSRAEVERLTADYIQINGGQDTSWLTEGTQRYGADPQVPALLAEIQGLRVYAFFDQLARLHPGESVQCNG